MFLARFGKDKLQFCVLAILVGKSIT